MTTPSPPPGTGGTLVDELERAADYFQALAREFGSADGLSMCRKLRRRAERVRRLELALSARSHNTLTFDFVRSIVGPLSPTEPAATPTEPKP